MCCLKVEASAVCRIKESLEWLIKNEKENKDMGCNQQGHVAGVQRKDMGEINNGRTRPDDVSHGRSLMSPVDGITIETARPRRPEARKNADLSKSDTGVCLLC